MHYELRIIDNKRNAFVIIRKNNTIEVNLFASDIQEALGMAIDFIQSNSIESFTIYTDNEALLNKYQGQGLNLRLA